MPSWLRRAIADALLALIQSLTYVTIWLWRVADKCRSIPLVGGALEDLFDWISDGFADLQDGTNDVRTAWFGLCDWLDDVADELDEVASDVYGWLSDRISYALNRAESAWAWAREALNRVDEAIDRAIAEAAAALAAAIGYADSLVQDLDAWIYAHGLDIYQAIRQYLADVDEWILGHVADVWDAIMGFAVDLVELYMAAIAAPINLIILWFDDIQGFFNDPLEWLRDRFTDWFLGREE